MARNVASTFRACFLRSSFAKASDDECLYARVALGGDVGFAGVLHPQLSAVSRDERFGPLARHFLGLRVEGRFVRFFFVEPSGLVRPVIDDDGRVVPRLQISPIDLTRRFFFEADDFHLPAFPLEDGGEEKGVDVGVARRIFFVGNVIIIVVHHIVAIVVDASGVDFFELRRLLRLDSGVDRGDEHFFAVVIGSGEGPGRGDVVFALDVADVVAVEVVEQESVDVRQRSTVGRVDLQGGLGACRETTVNVDGGEPATGCGSGERGGRNRVSH